MTSTQNTTNTTPAAIVARLERAAKRARDNAGKEIGDRAKGLVEGILFTVEAMGFDGAEVDALYDLVDDIMSGAK